MTTFKNCTINTTLNTYLIFYHKKLRKSPYYVTEVDCTRDLLLYHIDLSYQTRYPSEIAEDLFKIRHGCKDQQYSIEWDQGTMTLSIKGQLNYLIPTKSSLREDIDIDTILHMSKGLIAYEYILAGYRLEEVLYPGYDKDLLEYMYE